MKLFSFELLKRIVFWEIVSNIFFPYTEPQLVVNVKAHTGEVFQEIFHTNMSDDSVSLEFELQDGSYITQVIDFKQELQVFRILLRGEEELNQIPFHVLCFITTFSREDFISSDAMSKLRQKNPNTVRTPERDLGTEELEMNSAIDVEASSFISPHIRSLCSYAVSSTFAVEQNLKLWFSEKRAVDWDWSTIREAMHRVNLKSTESCEQISHLSSSCACNAPVCISWYPCGLKYCTGKDNAGKTVSYRCGIQTCRKCYNFKYVVTQKQSCIVPL